MHSFRITLASCGHLSWIRHCSLLGNARITSASNGHLFHNNSIASWRDFQNIICESQVNRGLSLLWTGLWWSFVCNFILEKFSFPSSGTKLDEKLWQETCICWSQDLVYDYFIKLQKREVQRCPEAILWRGLTPGLESSLPFSWATLWWLSRECLKNELFSGNFVILIIERNWFKCRSSNDPEICLF
jgi:hypothetical protein